MFADTATNKCLICKTGYILNVDKKCEIIDPPLCQSNVLGYLRPTATAPQKAAIMALWPDLPGCNTCDDGYAPFLETANKSICMASPYYAADTGFNADKKYVLKCLYASAADYDPKDCKVCKDGYVVSLNNLNCTQQSSHANLANCVQTVTQSGSAAITNCNACASSYLLLNHACVAKALNNCSAYKSTFGSGNAQ